MTSSVGPVSMCWSKNFYTSFFLPPLAFPSYFLSLGFFSAVSYSFGSFFL